METKNQEFATRIEQALSSTGATKEVLSEKLLAVKVGPDKINEAMKILREKVGVSHLSTITGIDAGDKIEIDYQFWEGDKIISLKTAVPKSNPQISTCTPIIPGAILYEMEVHDMFGVTFEGHPWMDRKLLLPDNYPSDLPPPLLKSTSSERIRKAVGIEK
jgi:NADH:ubiquinone oxidoreductase subunit C